MAEKIIYFLYFLVSLFSYYTAPLVFSPEYCLVQFRIFLIVALLAIWINRKRYGSFFNATNIFLVLFMMATYLHSIYYYQDEKILSSFTFGYNQNVVNKAICMAQIGISSYLFGTSLVKMGCYNTSVGNTNWISKKHCLLFQNISFIIACGWFIYIFAFFTKSKTYIIVYPRLTLLLTSILLFTLVLTVMYEYNHNLTVSGIKMFLKRNIKLMISFCVFLLPFFYLNSRTNPAAIALVAIMLIHFYYRKFSFSFFILFAFLAFVLMAIVSYSRISDINTSNAGPIDIVVFGLDFLVSNEHSTTYLLQDYMLNIRNLYDGIEYPLKNNYLYGLTYFPILFSAIPFLPTIILNILGYDVNDVDTSQILTVFNDSDYGLGTHIIGDLYMNGGILFVIVGMFFLGYVISWSEKRNTFWGVLASCSIYGSIMMLPRISFLSWFTTFSYFVVLYLISKNLITH